MAGTFSWLESMAACEVPNTLFEKQTKLQTTQNMFLRTYNLTGAITQAMLRNSIGTLTDIRGMFQHCNLTSIASGFLNLGSVNKKLTYMWTAFYSNDNLEGSAPAFWNKALFTNIQESQAGYWGAFYGTNITNKEQAEAVSANWTVQQTT